MAYGWRQHVFQEGTTAVKPDCAGVGGSVRGIVRADCCNGSLHPVCLKWGQYLLKSDVCVTPVQPKNGLMSDVAASRFRANKRHCKSKRRMRPPTETAKQIEAPQKLETGSNLTRRKPQTGWRD